MKKVHLQSINIHWILDNYSELCYKKFFGIMNKYTGTYNFYLNLDNGNFWYSEHVFDVLTCSTVFVITDLPHAWDYNF